ncbi:MAG TPA: DUF4129 domain-containing protein [Bryobacteraceae bacterium]|nr:DUF4129 domain-containing protein [Bryobacteraceae bacterium]
MNSVDLLEESVNLLRGASLDTAVTYLIGAVPLTLAFLFFLADMNRSPYAFEHLPWASLVLALLYVWKNSWQAIFMAKLYRQLSPVEIDPAQAILMQSTWQPLGLILPLPFPWISAFFRNVALYSAMGRRDALRAARKQSVYATRQNWGVLSIVALGSLLLFINVLFTIMLLPQLGRSFLGIEGDLARLGNGILNLTTIGVAAAITWMAVDPLLDAVYVLRCFYGEAVVTGADLRAALKKIAIVILMITSLHAQPVDQEKLDHAIDQVVHQREFTWRSPRPEGAEPEGKWVGWYRSTLTSVREFKDFIWNKIKEWLKPDQELRGNGKDAAVNRKTMFALITLIVALIAAGVVVFLLRRTRRAVVAAQAVTAAPPVNLADESLTADRLPEAEWLALADEWIEKGDFRMALKAMYLAALNYLSARELVSVRRWKSGLDYRRELARRARSKPELPAAFTRSVAIFEQGWYGRHEVDRAMAESLANGFNEMRACAK